jgi:hypothetical protein
MTIDDVWKSPGNTPSPAARDAVLAQTRAQLRRIQRRRVAFVAWTAVTLLAASGLVTYVWATRPDDLAGAAPMLALLLAQWAAFALFLRDLRSGGRVMGADASIRESLERLWQEGDQSRRRQLTVLALYAAAVPLVAMAILQLRDAGKMAPGEALSATLAFGAVITVGTSAILVRRYWRILPRQRRLSALLEQYRSE